MQDLVGKVVPEEEVAADLGFASLEQFKEWQKAGHPTGRCSNPHCYRPAFFPHLQEPCKYCGSPVTIHMKVGD